MPLDGATTSDLNYLFFRQQVERSRAITATSPAARKVHAELAALYQQRINRLTSGNIRFALNRPEPLSR
jgi:hypothetical protein